MKQIGSQLNKILTAAISLVLALSMAVFACYAWFTSSQKVNSDGITATVESANITDFKVDFYYLSATTDSGTTTYSKYSDSAFYTVSESGSSNTADTPLMPAYLTNTITIDGTTTTYSTSAVLWEISFTVNDSDITSVDLTFTSSTSFEVTGSSENGTTTYSSGLSNAVGIFAATQNGTETEGYTYTKTETNGEVEENTFYISEKKDIKLENIEVSSNNTLYYLMDYNETNMTLLYRALSEIKGASLSDSINLDADISINLKPTTSSQSE